VQRNKKRKVVVKLARAQSIEIRTSRLLRAALKIEILITGDFRFRIARPPPKAAPTRRPELPLPRRNWRKAGRVSRRALRDATLMKLEEKLKVAFDENRLLILGAQVLFGFQFNAVFQDAFADLPLASKALACAALALLMLTVGFLIAPAMDHRIVERGQASPRVLAMATAFAGWALLPLSIGLACDLFIAVSQAAGLVTSAILAAGFFALAVFFWFALAFVLQRKDLTMPKKESAEQEPLSAQVSQLLTEARVIIPGAQALLGFQLAVTLTHAFAQLPSSAKMVHVAALCCIGVAIILLMAPASLHRIAFGGEDSRQFVAIASFFVVAAPLPVALGIVLDAFVATSHALQSDAAGAALALAAALFFLGTWYGYPLARRRARS
jgi:hypothetical protein